VSKHTLPGLAAPLPFTVPVQRPARGVYVFQLSATGTQKIGIGHWRQRREHAETWTGGGVEVLGVFSGAVADERDLHRVLRRWRVRREHFNLPQWILVVVLKADRDGCTCATLCEDIALAVEQWQVHQRHYPAAPPLPRQRG
jgi:hypothetical protein